VPQFSPDLVTYGDVPGLGMWDDSHAREHLQFVQILATQTPAILIPNFDFLQMLTAGGAERSIVETHNQAHNLLSQITGITAVDFSQFNLKDESDFYNFTGYHSTTHQQLRQYLGIV
jgi:hypothetical protein